MDQIVVGINVSMCREWSRDDATGELFPLSTGYVVNWQKVGEQAPSSKVFVEPYGVRNFVAELLGVPIKKKEKHGQDKANSEPATD